MPHSSYLAQVILELYVSYGANLTQFTINYYGTDSEMLLRRKLVDEGIGQIV